MGSEKIEILKHVLSHPVRYSLILKELKIKPINESSWEVTWEDEEGLHYQVYHQVEAVTKFFVSKISERQLNFEDLIFC